MLLSMRMVQLLKKIKKNIIIKVNLADSLCSIPKESPQLSITSI